MKKRKNHILIAFCVLFVSILCLYLYLRGCYSTRTKVPVAPRAILARIEESIVYSFSNPDCQHSGDCFRFVPRTGKKILLTKQTIAPYINPSAINKFYNQKDNTISPNGQYKLIIQPGPNDLNWGIFEPQKNKFYYIDNDHMSLEGLGWAHNSQFYFFRLTDISGDDEVYLICVYDTSTHKTYRLLEKPVSGIDILISNQ